MKTSSTKPKAARTIPARAPVAGRQSENENVSPPIPAAQAFSFLKETRGLLTWTVGDLARALNISKSAAERVIAILQIQGYVVPQGNVATTVARNDSEWLTTAQGEAVSGSKAPRFTRDSVQRAVAALSERIKAINADGKAARKADRKGDTTAPCQIDQAVAFGDFLRADASRVQAADVGISLKPRRNNSHFAEKSASRQAFFRQLSDRTPALNLIPYEEWMSHRSHQKLI
jgi:hypothetical protein